MAGAGGEPAPGGTSGNGNIAPVGGDVSDKSMSHTNFAGGTTIDSGLSSATLGEGGDGHKGGAGGGGGYGGGGGSGPNYTCGHSGVHSLMYCGAAGGGSYADGSSLGSSNAAPSSWYGDLSTSGSSTITIWIASL